MMGINLSIVVTSILICGKTESDAMLWQFDITQFVESNESIQLTIKTTE